MARKQPAIADTTITEQQLDNQIKKLSTQRERLVVARDRAQNAHLVGKCFVGDNGYGNSSSFAPWKIYYRVDKLTDRGNAAYCTVFEYMSDSTAGLSTHQHRYIHSLTGMKPITTKQFERAFDRFLDKLTKAFDKA